MDFSKSELPAAGTGGRGGGGLRLGSAASLGGPDRVQCPRQDRPAVRRERCQRHRQRGAVSVCPGVLPGGRGVSLRRPRRRPGRDAFQLLLRSGERGAGHQDLGKFVFYCLAYYYQKLMDCLDSCAAGWWSVSPALESLTRLRISSLTRYP